MPPRVAGLRPGACPYQYGFMLSKFGYSEEEALAASHVSSVGGNDDRSDDPAIQFGYALEAHHPNAMADEFYKFSLGGDHVQEMLEAETARYVER